MSEREKCKRDRERGENERDKTVIERGGESERKNRYLEREWDECMCLREREKNSVGDK